jgi:hypothetical protein
MSTKRLHARTDFRMHPNRVIARCAASSSDMMRPDVELWLAHASQQASCPNFAAIHRRESAPAQRWSRLGEAVLRGLVDRIRSTPGDAAKTKISA